MKMSLSSGQIKHKVERFLAHYWLPLGFFILLTGFFWLPGKNLYTKFYYAFYIFPLIILIFINGGKALQILKDPIVKTLLALSLLVIASFFWSHTGNDFISVGKRPFYIVGVFLGCGYVFAKSNHSHLAKHVLLLAATTVVLFCIYNLFVFYASSQHRMIGSGALMNPLLTSHVLGMFAAFWLALCVQKKKIVPLNIVAFLVMLAAVIATGSRTPLLGLGVCCLWLLVIWRHKITVFVVGSLGVGTLAGLVFNPEVFAARGFSYRIEIWEESIRQIMVRPLLGLGYDSPLSIPVPSIERVFYDPHNIELAVALELGALGLFLWCVMYFLAIKRCVQLQECPELLPASTMLLYGLAAGITEGSSYFSRPNESWFLIWIPLALVVGLSVNFLGSENSDSLRSKY
ncbi:MAG: O-antigen ligase family protein [Desulfuromonadaceae bacterium]|nr:O-antigen ligase family protein [Desulfuromonadaceae bacterium]